MISSCHQTNRPAGLPRRLQISNWLPKLGLMIAMAVIFMADARCDEKKAEAAAEPEKQVAPTAADKDLAARTDKAIPLAQGTPGQEAANFITNDWPKGCLERLKGRPETSTEKELAGSRDVVKGLLDAIEKGPSWPHASTLMIPLASSAITIDGSLDENAWQDALATTKSFEYGKSEIAAGVDTVWRMTWNEKYLYIAFDCGDTEIVAPKLERDGAVYGDDCVEVFILPSFDPPDYWELIINPSGAVFDALHRKKLKGWGAEKTDLAKSIEGLQFAVGKRLEGGPGYTIEIAIPFAQLPGRGDKAAKAGEKFFIMISRFDRTSAGFKTYSFVPLLSWGHNIWNYVPAELAGP